MILFMTVLLPGVVVIVAGNNQWGVSLIRHRGSGNSRNYNHYPGYNYIPQTGFICAAKSQPGYYADVETQCQVFHRCNSTGRVSSHLCTPSTVFNQISLVCDVWWRVNCKR